MRAKLNLTVEKDIADEARDLAINMSCVAEEAIVKAAKIERNRRWFEENQEALVRYAEEIEREGLPLEKYHRF